MKLNWTMNQETNRLTIMLEGRIDSTNVAQAEEAVMEIKNQNEGAEIVFDAKDLEYISSAGLRVLLSAQKKMQQNGSMKVTHICEDVMEVFEMTGFADILTIE